MKKEYNNQINSNLMKKVLLLCFISIVALFGSRAYAQGTNCCFWVEKENVVIPEEVFSLAAPAWQQTDYYYFHFTNDCNLPRNTKWSIGWEIRRNGVLLDNSTDLAKLSQYAEIAFQINTVEYGWVGGPSPQPNVLGGDYARSGVGNQYAAQYLNNPIYADFPGAMPYQGNIARGYFNIPNFQSYNFFYLHFLEYVHATNGMRMKITWNGINYYGGDYEIKFTLYERSGGTEIEHNYIPAQQQDYYGGHQSGVIGIIAEFTLDPMERGSVEATICADEIFQYGVQPDGTPYTFSNNTVTWPNSVVDTFIVPTYIQPTPCYGPAVARIDTLFLTVNPLPPAPVVANVERCGPGDVTFTVTNPESSGVTYIWYADAAMTTELGQGTTLTVTLTNTNNVVTTTTYYILARSADCDNGPIPVTATSNPVPELSLTYANITCPYNHTENVVVAVTPTSYVGTLTYEWTGAQNNGATGVVTIDDECDKTYPFTVTVTDGTTTCTNSISGTITAEDHQAPIVTGSVPATTIVGCSEDLLPAPLNVAGLIAAGFTFTDNCTDPANGTLFTAQADSVVREGTDCNIILKRYYVVKDHCGNASAPFYHQFNVVDNEAPTFTAPTQPYVAERGMNCTYIVTQGILDQILEDLDFEDNCTDSADIVVALSVVADSVITGTIDVQVTLTDLCSNSSIAIAQVILPPPPTVTINAVPATLEICSGDTIAFNLTFANAFPPYQIVWSDTTLQGTSVTVTPVSADQYVDETFVYTVTVTDSLGCVFTDQVTVTVWGVPNFNLTPDHEICLGESTTLTAALVLPPPIVPPIDMVMPNANNGPFTYLWSTGDTTASITVTPTTVGNHVYTVTVTNEHGCSNIKTVTVTVNPVPVATMNITGTGIAEPCLYNNVTLNIEVTSDIPANAMFVITVVKDGGAPVTVPNTNGVGTYTVTEAGTYVVTAYTYDAVTNCQSLSVSQTFTFYPVPQNPTLTANPAEFCLGESTTLTALPYSSTYTYLFTGQTVGSNNNTLVVTPEIPGTFTYNVSITTTDNCVVNATVDVIVNPLPEIESITSLYECPNVVNNVPVANVTSGTPPYTYTWSGTGLAFDASGNPYLADINCNAANDVTVVVTDSNGCTATATSTIYLVDTIKPTVALAGQQPEYSVTCEFITAASIEEVTVADNCTPSGQIVVYFWEERIDGVCPHTYDLVRKWRAKDKCGNFSDTLVQVIHVVDETAPTMTAVPADFTVSCDSLQPANVNDPALAATDNCFGAAGLTFTVVETIATTATANTYLLYRDWYATDSCDNVSAPMRQTITVTDLVAPVLSSAAPANSTINCDDPIPAVPIVTFTDNCDQNPTVNFTEISTQSQNSADSTYYNYTITRTWIATDNAGNGSTPVQQFITVQDIVAPTVVATTVPADVTVDCDAVPAPAVVEFTDNCDNNPTIAYNQASTQDADPTVTAHYNYTITRTWQATDASGNASGTSTQVITVQDVTDPALADGFTAPANVTINCSDAIPTKPNLEFVDNCDNNPTIGYTEFSTQVADPLVAAHYNYTITRTWTVTDVIGNQLVVQYVITVEDVTAPVLTDGQILPVDTTLTCDQTIPTADETTVAFTDNCSPVTVTYTQVITGNPATNEYTITRTWVGTDVSGNASTPYVQVITIEDNEAPTVITTTIPDDATVECDDIPLPANVEFEDNCDATLTITFTEVSTQDPDATVIGHYNYTITRTWTATDAAGNVSDPVVQVITVQDVTAPEFTFVPAATTIYTDADCDYDASLAATGGPATATDNCDPNPVVTYNDVVTGPVAGVWTITRTWTATDVAGNTVDSVQIITVEDNINPTFTVPAGIAICKHVDGTYADLITPDLTGEPTNVLDNCSTNLTVTYTDDESTAGTADTDGHITRTWRVTDEAGNYTEAIQIITTNHTPVVVITGSENICWNETVPQMLTASGADTYVWSTGATTAAIGITVEGTYTVTGTIANGCSNEATIIVTNYETPTITSDVNDQICIGDVITLRARATYEDASIGDGNWVVTMISGATTVTNTYTGQVGELTHTTAPVFEDTYFELTFTDVHGCTYPVHTTATTLVNDDPRLRLYTDSTQAPNNVLNVETGELAKFYIKVEVCGDYDRRAQIQFQVYKDGQIVNDMLPYLSDNQYSVSYYIAQNGILHPNENNTYYNRIPNGTIPYANTELYAPFNGFFVSYSTNAYDWFYMHFFSERFIRVNVNYFTQPGQYTIVYKLIGADPSCALTDNSTNYVAGMSYGGSGFPFCNNTIEMATNTMIINVSGDPIIIAPDPHPAPSPVAPTTQKSVTVYPNPAGEEAITLHFDNMSGDAVINVVSLNGKVLYEFDTKISDTKRSYTLPQMKLNPGIYFIKVVNDKAVLTKKLVIQ